MPFYKKRVITLLVVEALLIIIHKLFDEKIFVVADPVRYFARNYEIAEFITWHYLLSLGFAAYLVLYCLNIRCVSANCRKRQVFQGWSILDLRLPGEKCYSCGIYLRKDEC